MKTSSKLVLSMLLAGAAVSHHAAWAHAALQRATPAKDAALSASPKEVSLRFNEKLEAAFSAVKVIDGSGHDVSSGKSALDASDPAVLRVAVPLLPAGKYSVQWSVVGHDGHRRKGDYTFTVK